MISRFILSGVFFTLSICAVSAHVSFPQFPDELLEETYRQAATKNVLAAVNPAVFPGYWSVCADGQGFGFGNSYPSLDGLQLADALLWLGQEETVRLNWEYVHTFLKEDGSLPLAILPGSAGQPFGNGVSVDPNGGLYTHWVIGNPLSALAAPTFIANTYILFAYTQDRRWLEERIEAVNRTAEQLQLLTTEEGRVRGAGYYVERPTRVDSDGVSQTHAVYAFEQVAAMNQFLGRHKDADRFSKQAQKIRQFFIEKFWQQDHFAEYYSPERGFISHHGLTDSDWGAIAFGVITPEQKMVLFPRLVKEPGFYYGNMPAGIATKPETYEDWEFTHPDRHDLGAMGRVWYLMAHALYQENDAQNLLKSLHAVANEGKKNDFYWRERYHPDGQGGCVPAGPNTYCEYPANLVRIVNRFLLGIDLRLDGSIVLAPLVVDSFWEAGFGHRLSLPHRELEYHFDRKGISGTYWGEQRLRLWVRLHSPSGKPVGADSVTVTPLLPLEQEGEYLCIVLPSAKADDPVRFQLKVD
ncbi:MAG: hypothetical protein LBI05_02890 [Planctomycetaceae bacterium]|jgi:hypothetical protein|nr:hypothetical protein [Planctomycetaceae bacterium]